MDAAGRRADRWKEATEEMLQPWFAVHNKPALHTKCNIAEWLRNKYETLSQAFEGGEILKIDLLDAVVRIPVCTLCQRAAPMTCIYTGAN